jgi:acyl-CoA synthetase (AMP-forming)/AMP-acid ligase II
MTDFKHILENGVSITSSGTTGEPKTIFRTPENLRKVIEVAIDAQKISKQSRILTVTRMTHAGGLLTQSLPGYTLGCDIKIQQFNAYSFLKDFKDYTHTFLTPAHMWALMQTKDFANCDLTGKWILGGSDPVSWEMIEAFTSKGATVQPNWGMSEVGPVTINSVFTKDTDIKSYKNLCRSDATILGDKFYIDWRIDNDILYVKGDLVYKEGWLCTGDRVVSNGGILFYLGRDASKNTNG